MEDTTNDQHGRTSANNLDDGISRLDKTLNKIYLPEIMAARRVIHSRMRRKKERQMAGGPRNGPTLYDYIMESRRRKGGGQSVGVGEQQPLDDVPEGDEKREHHVPTRQDSAFQSVDLTEIAGLREDPNRTPTPQPTFTDGPQQIRQERQTDRTEAVAALSTASQKTQSNSRSSSGQSTRSEEVHERYELQVKPGYADAQQVEMATAACRVNDQRRNSYSNTTEQKVDYRQDSAASDPGEVREKSLKKKQQQREANDLDLAQKIILKRKVEEYIDRQEPATTIDEVVESCTQEAAWMEESEVTDDVVVKESIEKTKQRGRESVQTVVSHRTESSAENSPVPSREEVSSAKSAKSPNPNRPESGSNSRSSTAGSDLNPHPVLPAIGTPPATDESESPQQEESDGEEDVPVAETLTAGAVAAGAGTAAAVAIKANNAEKAKSEKTKENKKQKKDKKLSAKMATETHKTDKPKVQGPKADAARDNAPRKPEKKEKSKENKKPLSLIDMSPGEMKSTIDALDKMVDANIQDVIDNTKGKKPVKSTGSENDRRMVKAVMNPAFQAEINNFLAHT